MGLWRGGSGRGGRLVPGRGGPLPGDPPTGRVLAAGGRAAAAAARVHPWGHRQAAHPVAAGHGRGAREGRAERAECGAPSLAANRADASAGRVTGSDATRGRAAGPRALGNLAGPRVARAVAPVAVAPHLGQPRRAYELGDGALAVPAGRHAAVHPAQWLVAEYGGGAATDRGRASPGGTAPAQRRGTYRVAGGHRGRLECVPNAVRLGRQAP